MGRVDSILRLTNLILLAVMVYAAWEMLPRLLNRRAAESKRPDPYLAWVDPKQGVKVLHFYASPGVVLQGEAASLCFGVSNAKTVSIEPEVDDRLWPTFNRCFQVSPAKDTEYKLTAGDGKGQTVHSSFVLRVEPNPDLRPRIPYFEKRSDSIDYLGRRVSLLCYQTWNAATVKMEPAAFPGSITQGCFYVAPEKQTTYTLTASDRFGNGVRKTLTVEAAK